MSKILHYNTDYCRDIADILVGASGNNQCGDIAWRFAWTCFSCCSIITWTSNQPRNGLWLGRFSKSTRQLHPLAYLFYLSTSIYQQWSEIDGRLPTGDLYKPKCCPLLLHMASISVDIDLLIMYNVPSFLMHVKRRTSAVDIILQVERESAWYAYFDEITCNIILILLKKEKKCRSVLREFL